MKFIDKKISDSYYQVYIIFDLKEKKSILNSIKEKRNNLAHGTVSFVEALRDDSILDIEDNEKFISNFLEEVISLVSHYLSTESYKVVSE